LSLSSTEVKLSATNSLSVALYIRIESSTTVPGKSASISENTDIESDVVVYPLVFTKDISPVVLL
jgi:hypothetical protein